MNKPVFTIITTVFNAVETVESTILSVINQSCKNFEYIIVDAKSTDGTLDIIKKYSDKIDSWVSEKDSGIYEGMNKGTNMAKGEFLFFLNADDCFFDNKVLKDIEKLIRKHPNLDIIYGKVENIDEVNKLKYISSKISSENKLQKASKLHHQGTFMKRKILEENNHFDLKYPLAADFDLFCKCFTQHTYNTEFTNRFISRFLIGGKGGNREKNYLEVKEIIKKHFGYFPYLRFLIFKKFENFIFRIISYLKLLKPYYKAKSYLKNYQIGKP